MCPLNPRAQTLQHATVVDPTNPHLDPLAIWQNYQGGADMLVHLLSPPRHCKSPSFTLHAQLVRMLLLERVSWLLPDCLFSATAARRRPSRPHHVGTLFTANRVNM